VKANRLANAGEVDLACVRNAATKRRSLKISIEAQVYIPNSAVSVQSILAAPAA
jgi:hypothetical protein